jgi:hypothetical protein
MKALRTLLRTVVPALLAGLLLTGCPVQSLHPLFDDQAPPLTMDKSLLGTWQTDKGFDDKPASLIIADDDNDRYSLKYTEDGQTTELRGVLVQAGKRRFVDVWMHSLEQFKVPLPGAVHLLPTHSFWSVSAEGDTLSCAYVSYEELEEGFKAGKVSLAHTEVEDAQIVTASPAELRAFLPKYAADPAVFAKPLVFHRQK